MSSPISTVEYDQLIDSLNNALFGDSNQESPKEDFYESTSDSETITVGIDDRVRTLGQFIRENYQNRLIQLIYMDNFYPDASNQTIQFVGQLKDIYGNTVLTNWFTRLYNERIGDSRVLKGLLYTILYYSDCFGDLVELSAQAALSHNSKEINELGVRILESQCNEKHYRILCNLKVRDNWLQKYIDKVKIDFRKELCLS